MSSKLSAMRMLLMICTGDKQKSRTTFMVLKEGRLVFEDDQDAIESSIDPYIIKFVKQRV